MAAVTAMALATVAAGAYAANESSKASDRAGRRTEDAAMRAEGLSRERFEESQRLLDPSIQREEAASNQMMVELGLREPEEGSTAGSAYRETEGYQNLMDESLRAVEQSAASAGGTAYGGRRLQEAGRVGAGVESSYYSNYMNMLQNMASPRSATNLSSMGMGQAAQIGGQNIAATNTANQYSLMGTQAENQALADAVKGGSSLMASGGFL